MTNVVGLQTDDAGNVGQNSSAHVACVVGLQTDAVVVTERGFIELIILDALIVLIVTVHLVHIKLIQVALSQ